MNIKEIPLQELLKDKDKSLEDIKICAKAIRLNVKHSGGSIQDRLDTNKRIVEKINNELARRRDWKTLWLLIIKKLYQV